MHIQEANDWVIFNNITYQIHQIADFHEMCQNFLEQMRLLMDFDGAVFYYSSDTELPKLTHAVCCNYSEATAQEYLDEYQERFQPRASDGRKKYGVSRERYFFCG